MKVYRETDIDTKLILDARVAVIGYGNQGHAHALNLRDSGVEVKVGAHMGGHSWARAVADGFEVLNAQDAASWGDVVMLTLPDTALPAIYAEQIEPALRPNSTLLFAHGYCLHFNLITPHVPVGLVSPKGPGNKLRERYDAGSGLPGLVAGDGAALPMALAYAWGIGCARRGVLLTTIEEETVTDLFGEQAVLCGGVPELIKAGFQTLVDAGYQPEVAYFESVMEAKLILDLLLERGFEGMREAISDTAEWGGYQAGPRLVTTQTRETMQRILEEIQDGTFSKNLQDEASRSSKELKRLRSVEAGLGIEKTAKEMRNLFRES